MNKLAIVTKGIFRENPTFILMLGICPLLGTTTSALDGMGMGLATLFVLILSNVAISLIKNLIPSSVRLPAYIVVIASFVSVLQLLMEAYTPALYETLGVFIPLIVVNCIIFARAEMYASKHNAGDSALDGLGMGLGFTMSLTLLGAIRELLGNGSFLGWKFLDGDGILIFVLAPGAFLAMAYLLVVFKKLISKKK